MPNIRDLAKHSGVSITTVSRVLNGDKSGTSESTRQRVMEAVRDLQYTSLPAGPVSKRVKTKSIAIIVENLTERPLSGIANGYFAGIYDGVLEESINAGYSSIVHAQNVWRDDQTAIRHTFDGRCDGVIFLAPVRDNDTLPALWERGIPLVIVGSPTDLPKVSTIDIANEDCAALAVRTLVNLGHKNIVYFGADDFMFSSAERRRGYRRGLVESGIGGENARQYLTAGLTESSSIKNVSLAGSESHQAENGEVSRGWIWLEDLVEAARADGPFDAIVCWNRSYAEAAINELLRVGIRVPDDVSVISFDYLDTARQDQPVISGFTHPLYEIGKQSVQLMLERIDSPDSQPRHVRIVPDLVMTNSVIERN